MFTSSSTRVDWMDVLRGLAIILVILFHCVGLAGFYADHPFNRLETVGVIITPLRMPIIFILSGLLVTRSLAKGPWTYLSGKVRRVLYPYLLWAVIMFWIAAHWYENFGFHPEPDFWLIFIRPGDHLWFLAYLFIYYVLALATRRIPPLVVVFALIMAGAFVSTGEGPRFFSNAAAFFIGVALGPHLPTLAAFIRRRWTSIFLLGAAIALSAAGTLGIARLSIAVWQMPLYVAGFLGAAGCVAIFASARWCAFLRYIGRRTIRLYVLHVPFTMFPLAYLRFVGDTEPWTMLGVALILGFVPPLIITWLVDRYPALEWLFAWNPTDRSFRGTMAKTVR